jgi:holliday junction DNA helicase RuvA
MIGRIQGRLVEVVDSHALVDCAGVAYEVELTRSALDGLGLPGMDVLLYTHLIVREDAHLLFGFASRQERDVFRTLIRVNGVGPKLGISLLSSLSVGELATAVATGEPGRLTRVPGVGKRTAERLLVELKDKLDGIIPEGGATAPIYGGHAEALAALLALGYRQPEAERALANIPDDVKETEAIIRMVLKGFVRDEPVRGGRA